MKSVLRLSFFFTLTTLLTACNTIRGVGEDLSAVGNALSRAAD